MAGGRGCRRVFRESLALVLGAWLYRPMIAPASAWGHVASLVVRHAVVSLARHSGLPAVVVAAVGLVLAYRLARRAVHLVVEVALALALLLAATRAGWLRF
jgi:hypothetical protein